MTNLTPTLTWRILAVDSGIRTSEAHLDSPWGYGTGCAQMCGIHAQTMKRLRGGSEITPLTNKQEAR